MRRSFLKILGFSFVSYLLIPLSSILAATKYINGHSDVMIGAIIAKDQQDYNKIHAI